MTLELYFHPLASYCHKVLIALYEHNIAFEPIFVDLGDEKSSAAFRALWPLAKFPVLRDEARNCTVAESTVIIEHLDEEAQPYFGMFPMERKLQVSTPRRAGSQ